MLKMTHECDKCKKETTTVSESNTYINSKPESWSMPEIKTGNSTVRILLCDECSKKAGFGNDSKPSGSLNEKQSAAEKLVDILFEIADERGVFNDK